MSPLGKFFTRFFSPVNFGELKSNKLVSTIYGCDRGTAIVDFYTKKFLEQHEVHIKGRVLEIQQPVHTKPFMKKGIEVDVLHVEEGNPEATIVADLTKEETIPEGLFDCFVCTCTYNHIYDIESAIKNSYRLLKPGGVLLATLPCMVQISRYDMDRWGDFWRPTSKAASCLFEPVFGEDAVSVVPYGNVTSAIATLQGLACEDLPDVEVLNEHQDDYEVLIGVVAQKK